MWVLPANRLKISVPTVILLLFLQEATSTNNVVSRYLSSFAIIPPRLFGGKRKVLQANCSRISVYTVHSLTFYSGNGLYKLLCPYVSVCYNSFEYLNSSFWRYMKVLQANRSRISVYTVHSYTFYSGSDLCKYFVCRYLSVITVLLKYFTS